ncbi:hypothetical protein AGMMS49579_25300 [Spirochaetia bacterium]|nr:hypothetical protein AGMMS49579_25300 [Spirochaetia bacterium]
MIYKSLRTFSDNEIENINNCIFFGDNFSGYLSGFNLNKNETVIEYFTGSEEIFETGKMFKEYIREEMLMDKDGNDLREN